MAGSNSVGRVQGYVLNPPPQPTKIKRFTMVNRMQFYIDGAWVDPVVKKSTPVVNPATEEAMYEVALGSKADVDKAVAAARRAF
jgi:aldehyde dehydrogenase (NAD+)